MNSGAPLWKNDKLKNRDLSVPFILGRAAVRRRLPGLRALPVAATTATLVARVKTDGSAITAAPVLAGETLVVQTHDGDLYGYRPR